MYELDYFLIVGGFICFSVGCAIGYSELFNRYQDEPKAIHRSIISCAYMIINGLASLTAFILLAHYNIKIFKVQLDDIQVILTASFSGMFVLRSSFFSIKNNGKEIPIGPAALLTILLSGIDRLYDRERARDRADNIKSIMADIDFSKAEVDLSVACLNLMQNLTLEEQAKMRADVEAISGGANKFAIGKTKSIMLGLTLAKYTGFKTLQQAIEMLGEELKGVREADKQKILEEFLSRKAKELEVRVLEVQDGKES